MTKICIVCGGEFESRDRRSVVCRNQDCRREFARRKYKEKTTECVCVICGNTYLATSKQSKDHCHECAKAEKKSAFKNTYTQYITCKQCGTILEIVQKNKTQNPKYINPIRTCDACKLKNNEKQSVRMKLDNPSSQQVFQTIEEYEDERIKKEEEKQIYAQTLQERLEENKKATSIRMKENNPMFNKDIRSKVGKTLKEKWASGEIIIDKTKQSNYKGDRGIKEYLRTELKDWKKAALKNANYKCERCGKTNTFLHVHHLIPFTQIVESISEKHGFNLKTMRHLSDEYEILKKEVLSYHQQNDIAIVLCEDCHDEIDPHYHKPQNKINGENDCNED